MYAAAFPVRSGSSVVPEETPPFIIIEVPLKAISHSVLLVVVAPVEKSNFVNSQR